MKKSAALMVFATAASLVACGPNAPKANLQSDIDSLSYSIGVSNTQGLMDYATARLGVDSTQADKFIEGILEGTAKDSPKEKAHLTGMQIGQQVTGDMFQAINGQLFAGDSTKSLNKAQFVDGFLQAINKKNKVSLDEANTYVRAKAEAIQKDSVKINASEIDSLSYMMGITNTQGLMEYATTRMGVDSIYIGEFTKGIKKGTETTDVKQKAIMAGIQIGMQISNDMFKAINNQLFSGDSTKTLSKENFLAGFIDGVKGKNVISMDDANSYVRTKAEAIQKAALEAKFAEYKKENEDFLTKNKAKEGIKTTESGLQYRIVKAGKGKVPTSTSRVKVHYKGTLIDGTQFDSSYDRKEPAIFGANQVIKGWTEALTMMPVGSKWELFIPQELGYGAQGAGADIKPFSTLIFEVELLSIEK